MSFLHYLIIVSSRACEEILHFLLRCYCIRLSYVCFSMALRALNFFEFIFEWISSLQNVESSLINRFKRVFKAVRCFSLMLFCFPKIVILHIHLLAAMCLFFLKSLCSHITIIKIILFTYNYSIYYSSVLSSSDTELFLVVIPTYINICIINLWWYCRDDIRVSQ